jgi:unsaturated rhamnogalacturonyl hydrolase
MWLDGLYMGQPFYAEYSLLFGIDSNWEDIANQFVWMEKNSRNPQTGLLYHGWDESKVQAWAHPETGQSPNYWSRAMGWYAMALVDVLDYFPANHPRRGELIAILQRFLPAVIRYQDAKTGGWYQVTDRMGDEGNYIEASGTAMFTYSIAKAVRKKYLAASYFEYAKKAYDGIQKNLITTDENGQVHLENTVSVSGLGGDPYRDGSYAYYLSEKIRQDDMKGVGPLIFASIEIEIAENLISIKSTNV